MKKVIITAAITFLGLGANAQNWLTAGNPLVGGEKLGSTTNFPIDFYINNAKKMSLTTGGNLSLITSTNAYQIAGNSVLWHKGDVQNIFVGVSAGLNNTAATGLYNTAVGNEALKFNTNQSYQTAVGYQALAAYNQTMPTYAPTNVACGYWALKNSQAYGGTAVGWTAGLFNTTGCAITAVGEEALRYNTTGSDNVGVGSAACHKNKTGNANTCVGTGAGDGATVNDTIWSNNSFFGAGAGLGVTTGSNNNAAFGYQALYTNTASANSAFGYKALHSNSSGYLNSAFGDSALYANSTGIGNVAFGDWGLTANNGNNNVSGGGKALQSNTSGGANTAMGYAALNKNTTYSDCSAFGYQALLNSTAYYNTGIGYAALKTNSTGANNTAVGTVAAQNISTGSNNTVIGYNACQVITTGDSNTFVGAYADANGAALHNCGGFGYGATATASDMIRIGNSKITVIQGQVGFTTSDARFKTNIQENVKGLAFINKLRPVTYQLKTGTLDNFTRQNIPSSADSSGGSNQTTPADNSALSGTQSGFIAQEVDQAITETNFNTNIIHKPANANDPYALSYEGLVVPLVKAMQELSKTVDSLKAALNQVTGQRTIQNNNGNSPANTTSVGAINVQLSNADVAVLNPNAPNPFAEQTVISYNIPQNANNAQILFYDTNGKQIKSVNIATKGQGVLNVYANDLTNGTYSYTLIIDGAVIATQKMIKQQ